MKRPQVGRPCQVRTWTEGVAIEYRGQDGETFPWSAMDRIHAVVCKLKAPESFWLGLD